MLEKARREEINTAVGHNKKLATKGYFVIGSEKIERKKIKEKDWSRDSKVYTFAFDFLETLPQFYRNNARELNVDEKGSYHLDDSDYADLRREAVVFLNYILDTFAQERDLTAVELGGQGFNLFSSFPQDFFRRTLGVCLEDIRMEEEKHEQSEKKHSVLELDILDTKGKALEDGLRKELGLPKTNLIICRMKGPLNHINKDPAILDRLIRNWYKLLKENGILFVQFIFTSNLEEDPQLLETIKKWKERVMSEFNIDIEVGKKSLRLHKKPGAPEELPPATQLFK